MIHFHLPLLLPPPPPFRRKCCSAGCSGTGPCCCRSCCRDSGLESGGRATTTATNGSALTSVVVAVSFSPLPLLPLLLSCSAEEEEPFMVVLHNGCQYAQRSPIIKMSFNPVYARMRYRCRRHVQDQRLMPQVRLTSDGISAPSSAGLH
jgi:hypothetical protein